MDKESQKRNKKAQIKYKVIDESFLKRTMLSILEADGNEPKLTRDEKRKSIGPIPNKTSNKTFGDMGFKQLRAAQKAQKEKEVKESDESRREHDINWVKKKKETKKSGETKVVFEPPIKEPQGEGN